MELVKADASGCIAGRTRQLSRKLSRKGIVVTVPPERKVAVYLAI